jgi:hypothetical protein
MYSTYQFCRCDVYPLMKFRINWQLRLKEQIAVLYVQEELDGLVVSGLGVWSRKLCNVGHWMGDQKFTTRAPPCIGRHDKPLVPVAFTVVSTHRPALGPRGGLWPVLLTLLCPYFGKDSSSWDINGLMMMNYENVKIFTTFIEFIIKGTQYNNFFVNKTEFRL